MTAGRLMESIDVPEELVIEIISHLPVKSLMRFKCVCKSWYAFVESPCFISKHLLNHKNNNSTNDGSYIIVNRRHENKDYFLLLSFETLDVICEDLGFRSFRDYDPMSRQVMLGCCNGVICLYDSFSYDIVFWNPATRQLKFVPESSIPHPKDSVLCGLEVGFCYDVKTNDYKVIRHVTFMYPPPFNYRPGEVRIEVYNLSTDSWRLIDAVLPGTFFGLSRPRACINGTYSRWGYVLYEEDGMIDFLISFDMSNEVFLVTPLPEVITTDGDEKDYYRAFAELNESVAFIRFTPIMDFEVWVLNEYGPDGSWTKLYTIGPLSDFFYPLGFWKNGELFLETNDGELVLCDPITQELKSLQVQGDYGSLEIFAYKESLVSIKGGNHLP